MAADTIEFEIKGLQSLQEKLEELPKKTADKVLRSTLKDCGELMRASAANHAPHDTGFMAQHFSQRTKIQKKDVAGAVFVGPDGKIDYPLDKLGSYKDIRNKKGKVKRSIGRVAVATVVRFLEYGTSKMSARPFMAQSFRTIEKALIARFVSDINKTIHEVCKD